MSIFNVYTKNKKTPNINNYINPLVPQNTNNIPKYTSPYATDIQRLQTTIQNRPSFAYDLNNDSIAQNDINNTVNSVSRIAAGKNMLYSDSNKNNMNKAALDRGNYYQNQAYQRYQDEGNNLLNQLNMLNNLENQNYARWQYDNNTAYSRGRDSLADTRYNDETAYSRGQTALNRTDNINAQLGYVNPFAGVQANPETSQYAGNYQAEINRRKATADTSDDYLINDLEAARVNKIFSDANLLKKYGDPYRTQDSRSNELNQNATIAGLTGMYQGKPTADQVYRNNQLAMDEKQLNANIANANADNARQWYSIRQSEANQQAKAAEKDPFSAATPQQRNMYQDYQNIFYATPGNEFYQNPDRVYQRLIGRPDIANDVGQDIYNYMVNQAETAASKVATVKPEQQTQTQTNNSNQSLLQATIDKQKNPAVYIKGRKYDIISTFGKPFYDSLAEKYMIE